MAAFASIRLTTEGKRYAVEKVVVIETSIETILKTKVSPTIAVTTKEMVSFNVKVICFRILCHSNFDGKIRIQSHDYWMI